MVFYSCKCRKVKGSKGMKRRRGRKRRGHGKRKKCKYGHRKGSKRCRKHRKK